MLLKLIVDILKPPSKRTLTEIKNPRYSKKQFRDKN